MFAILIDWYEVAILDEQMKFFSSLIDCFGILKGLSYLEI